MRCDEFEVSVLSDEKILITGVHNRRRIGFAVTKRAQEYGAEIVLTSFSRARRMTDVPARH
jgi:meromycolic acid enoyl-[acyl-carrier-protein] reductase